jgi:ring-1,2-phenylacetyl-CoA epoxidase subunit PaaC
MDARLQQALADKLLAMADDELILGHRNSEWTGHAPILEEDIAFANIAQDEMGHAGIWLSLRCRLTGEKPDKLVFFREAQDFRNVQMVELPRGDWAFTMLRQYLFDAFEGVRLARMTPSGYPPLAEAAAKIIPEELYHLRHSQNWVKRLGLGTDESKRRMQQALEQLIPYCGQLFAPVAGEGLLIEAGIVPEPAELQAEWADRVRSFLAEAGLTVTGDFEGSLLQRDQHTQYLDELLAEMQLVARADPQAEW